MCGILGYINNHPITPTNAINKLHHRGPDSNGKYTTQINDKHICIAHTRLSILDLSDSANQPMLSPDKQVIIAFNGEIYNYQQLQRQYLQQIPFQSTGDTEVLLHLYLKFGIDFIQYLNGDFAISILDKRTQNLFLIKDRLGIKPLYYAKIDSNLFFGSEINAIHNLGVKKELETENLTNFFVFKYSPKNETLFKNVNKLQPAHYLQYNFSSQQINIQRYWSPFDKKNDNLTYSEAKEKLTYLFDDAVKIRLVSDVPIGNFLSGGIDSSLIAANLIGNEEITHFCAKKSSKDIKKEGTSDDYYYASKLAKDFNLNLQEIPIGNENLSISMLSKLMDYSADLIADGSIIPSHLIAKYASKYCKVVLSGMGADELFFGYAGHQLTRMDQLQKNIPFSSLFMQFSANLDPGKGVLKPYKRYLHKIGKYHNYPQYKYGIYSIVGDFENSKNILKTPSNSPENILQSYFKCDNPWTGIQHFENENFLIKNLSYFDKMCMANSIENRVPFLDHRIAEFAYSLPLKYRLSNTLKTKKIVKDIAKEKIPSYIINRRKAGFGMPLRSLFSSHKNVNSLLDFDFINEIGFFDQLNIKNTISNHINGKEDNSSIIFALLIFQEWHKKYIN